MAMNSAQIASIEMQPIPPDRQCPRNATEIGAVIQDFGVIVGIASAIPSATGVGATPITNNTGQQALQRVEALEPRVDAIENNAISYRAQKISNLTAGGSVQTLSWSPALPSTNYVVVINFIGPTGNGGEYTWNIVNGTYTTTSVNVEFNDIPVGFSFISEIRHLPILDQT